MCAFELTLQFGPHACGIVNEVVKLNLKVSKPRRKTLIENVEH